MLRNEAPMSDLPIESRLKYGTEVYDDIDDLADLLTGAKRPARVAQSSPDREMDEDVFTSAADSSKHYGA